MEWASPESILISIRRQINESERLTARWRALVKAFQGVTAVLPKTALPASPELSRQCRANFAQLTGPLKDDPPAESIEEVGETVVSVVEEIARSNQATMDEVDSTMKDVVSTVAAVISGFRGHGERHESGLSKVADGFESLARIDNVAELRRRLREDVTKMRQTVAQMKLESEEEVRHFEKRFSTYQQRLEAARKGSDIDRLTMLGSRRMAERQIQQISQHPGATSVLLFDIDGFRQINERHGARFGDKLLQALAHLLRESFPEQGTLFRWGPDEFLAIAEGAPGRSIERCRTISETFSRGRYKTSERGQQEPVSATVEWGTAEYVPGEGPEVLCLRAREALEQHRRGARR